MHIYARFSEGSQQQTRLSATTRRHQYLGVHAMALYVTSVCWPVCVPFAAVVIERGLRKLDELWHHTRRAFPARAVYLRRGCRQNAC